MRRTTFAIGVLLAGCCAGKPPAATTRSAATRPTASRPEQPRMKYSWIVSRAEAMAVVVSARVPTGGWTLTIDRVEEVPVDGDLSAKIYVTLMPPPAGAMVTQAFATLEKRAELKEYARFHVVWLREPDGEYHPVDTED